MRAGIKTFLVACLFLSVGFLYISLWPVVQSRAESAKDNQRDNFPAPFLPGSLKASVDQTMSLDEELATCHVEKSGVKFLCHLDWQMIEVNDKTTMLIISSKPYVTLTISRLDSDIAFLGQLSRSFFKKRDLFEDNFQKRLVQFAGREAVEIKAFSKRRPDLRFLGFFYIYDSTLNSVLFSVYPEEKWEDYKFLIKKIVDSFRLI